MNPLLPQADQAVILDNSTAQGHTLVAFGHAGYMHWVELVPEWALALPSASLSMQVEQG